MVLTSTKGFWRRQLYVEFLPDALLSTDTKSRYEAYELGVDAGWLTLDGVRRKENLPALPVAERGMSPLTP